MKIEESNVVLNGQHRFESECRLEISVQSGFRAVLERVAETPEASSARELEQPARSENIRQLLEQLIAEIVALIAGREKRDGPPLRDAARAEEAHLPIATGPLPQQRREFAWESVTTETIRECESSRFSANGVICTADGRSIDFTFDLAMSREFRSERKDVSSGSATLRDPLVINFGGKAAELADTRFDFDLDSDGRFDSIPGLAGGSAFLVLDRNGDGRVNDGRELFGAGSGDGFADLALLDDDGNHWIDEADAAFAALKLWAPDARGEGRLRGLGESGLGAIYLGATETPFSLKDAENHLRGQVRSSGVYLREDGGVGSVQQIDLAV